MTSYLSASTGTPLRIISPQKIKRSVIFIDDIFQNMFMILSAISVKKMGGKYIGHTALDRAMYS